MAVAQLKPRVINQNFAHAKSTQGYKYRDRDKVLDIVNAAIEASGYTQQQISEGSGVSRSTLSKWGYKEMTRTPWNITITAVMNLLGYDQEWKKRLK